VRACEEAEREGDPRATSRGRGPQRADFARWGAGVGQSPTLNVRNRADPVEDATKVSDDPVLDLVLVDVAAEQARE